MQVIRTVQAMQQERTHWGGKVGFVPTMGYLHEGHLSLFRQARAENDILVASIFVNPTQFGPHEDFDDYPRNLERDQSLLESLKVDIVFTPSNTEMYPQGFITYVNPIGPLAEQVEGATRPDHFRGVATIVLKLFQIVQPDRAYFGQKDAQQVAVIARMIQDLHLPIQLHVLPTVREPDGLAMSSRNSYLQGQARTAASVLYKALQAGQAAFTRHFVGAGSEQGRASAPDRGSTLGIELAVACGLAPQVCTIPTIRVRQAMIDVIASEPLAKLDYAEIRDPRSFLPLETLQAPAVLLLAASIGTTRLIDNFVLNADGIWDTGTFLM
jgi:pantoate--beta-alanine ligase